jgi:hypothetical protein
MKQYCQINNNIIDNPNYLPQDTSHITNFNLLDSDENELYLRTLNYYRYEEPTVDYSTQVLGNLIQLPNGRVTKLVIDKSLEELKQVKSQEINNSFDNEMERGTVDTTLGWEIDARRSSKYNDLQNMESLYDYMLDYNILTTEVKGADNLLHECTFNQVENLAKLIRNKGLANYQKKFLLQEQINNCTDIIKLNLIQW